MCPCRQRQVARPQVLYVSERVPKIAVSAARTSRSRDRLSLLVLGLIDFID